MKIYFGLLFQLKRQKLINKLIKSGILQKQQASLRIDFE